MVSTEFGPALIMGADVLPINGTANVIGRRDRESEFRPDIDLTDYDHGHSVSRRHAQLLFRDGWTLMQDLGSTNGSSINGVSLTPEVPYPLRDGDIVGLGDMHAEFRSSCALPAQEVSPSEWPPEEQADTADHRVADPGQDVIFCDQCGERHPSYAKFCKACGNDLGEDRFSI
jgi:FHA domain